MKLTIGVDFDNTIACYDTAFSVVARELGLLDSPNTLSKSQIKEIVLARLGGDVDWKILQGQVYGKFIHLATVFPGFMEFAYRSKLKGHSVFIVSHKSEYGHFDNTKVNLRDAAVSWMAQNGIIGPDGVALRQSEIFFESTRREKIARIRALGCTHFIDDLQEVLGDPLFPEWTERILFSPDSSVKFEGGSTIETSWQTLETNLFRNSHSDESRRVQQSRFARKPVSKVVDFSSGSKRGV